MKKEPIYINKRDYELCKAALKDVANNQASATRIFAATMGGREKWQAVVNIWEDVRKNVGKQFNLYGIKATIENGKGVYEAFDKEEWLTLK